MARPCVCDKTDTCRVCWLFHNDSRYKTLYSGDKKETLTANLCPHLSRRVRDSNGKVLQRSCGEG